MSVAIPLSFPVFDHRESYYLEKALTSGFLATNGEFIELFESNLSSKLSPHQAVALCSGTSAIHLALMLLGVGHGDEVICQSFTFCASANPIAYLGATPVFVDSEEDTWNISPEFLEEAILGRIAAGRKPKAIVVVHLFGMPAKMHEIMEVSRKFDIPVLEDAAEALGSTYFGRACGTLGSIGIFSFNGNKIITTGGGGALISTDSQILERARYLSTQAREQLPYYQHLAVGYNYRMNNLAAGVGIAQLEKLDEFVDKRRSINKLYKGLFAELPGILFQPEQTGSKSNFWLSTILIDESLTGFSNHRLRELLLNNGIESRFLWKPLHLQPVYHRAPYYGEGVAEGLFSKGLCLPSSASLTAEDQKKIASIVERATTKVS